MNETTVSELLLEDLRRRLLCAQEGIATDACALRQLARGLPAGLDLGQQHLADDAHVALMRQQPRLLNLFRVELDTACFAGHNAIRRASLYDEHGERVDIAASYPIESTSPAERYRAIRRLFETASTARRERFGMRLEPRRFVVQIAVPKESCMQDWEALKPPGPRATLAEEFLAVAIDPLDEDDAHVDMREPQDTTRRAIPTGRPPRYPPTVRSGWSPPGTPP